MAKRGSIVLGHAFEKDVLILRLHYKLLFGSKSPSKLQTKEVCNIISAEPCLVLFRIMTMGQGSAHFANCLLLCFIFEAEEQKFTRMTFVLLHIFLMRQFGEV